MLVWLSILAIAAGLLASIFRGRHHWQVNDYNCRHVGSCVDGVLARLIELERRVEGIEAKIATVNERLGYDEERERWCDYHGISIPEIRQLGSLFPRVAALERQLTQLTFDTEGAVRDARPE